MVVYFLFPTHADIYAAESTEARSDLYLNYVDATQVYLLLLSVYFLLCIIISFAKTISFNTKDKLNDHAWIMLLLAA